MVRVPRAAWMLVATPTLLAGTPRLAARMGVAAVAAAAVPDAKAARDACAPPADRRWAHGSAAAGAGPTRVEKDTMGEIEVPADKLWGAQTQRSLIHFHISTERMPPEFLHALALVKRSAAVVNAALGEIPSDKAAAIVQAADEVLAGKHAEEFPLSIWQTGSATQTNMNMNEVLANRASEILGGERGMARKVHPNDDVNRGCSSNDVIPTALHVASVLALAKLTPTLRALRDAFDAKAREYQDVVKIGRTHLQDAVPMTLGQELSGYVAQLDLAGKAVDASTDPLLDLALGGTAVGTGLAAHPEFGRRVAEELALRTGHAFRSAPNKFAALAGHEPVLFSHGALKTLAGALFKIANDVRWLASGPRAGFGEIRIPANEPGSSIMAGKHNPTSSEMLTMLSVQVMANDVAVNVGGASGNFELNVFKPLILHNYLQSARLLTDGMDSFREFCVVGIEPNRERMAELVSKSLMLVTALVPKIGYDKSAEVAKYAHKHNTTLRDAALRLGYLSGAQFDEWVKAEDMVRGG